MNSSSSNRFHLSVSSSRSCPSICSLAVVTCFLPHTMFLPTSTIRVWNYIFVICWLMFISLPKLWALNRDQDFSLPWVFLPPGTVPGTLETQLIFILIFCCRCSNDCTFFDIFKNKSLLLLLEGWYISLFLRNGHAFVYLFFNSILICHHISPLHGLVEALYFSITSG